MPESLRKGAPGSRFCPTIRRGVLGLVLLLCLCLLPAAVLRAQPLSRGRIEVRARVLEPVGQHEIAAVLSQLERDARSQLEARVLPAAGRSGSRQIDERLVDHDRLRIALLDGAEGYTLQLEALAN